MCGVRASAILALCCSVDFYAPASVDQGHIVFGLSVSPSVCLSVCLSAKTLTFAIAFEWYVIKLSFFTYIYPLGVKPVHGYQSRGK